MDVHSEEQLQKISEKDEINLVEDIAVSESFVPIEEFSGILNGNGCTISGLQSAFIKEVSKDSTISELNFRNVSFTESEGIFEENNGCIDSIRVSGLQKEYGTTTNKFGGIVSENEGGIKNCSVTDSIIYQHGNLGVICSKSAKGSEIFNCQVDSTTCIQSGKFVGGIVANGIDMTIRECSVSNTEVNGTSEIGGIAGSCENVTVVDVCVKECDLECDKGGIGGVVADGEATEVRNASINTVNLTGRSVISFVGKVNYGEFVGPEDSDGSDGLIKSCSVVDCTATAASEYGVHIFSQRGIVQDSFVEDSEVITLKPNICTDLKELQNSYVDIEITTSSSIDVRESSSDESFYITATKQSVDSKKICVSEPEDFEDIQNNDTVELVNDIELEEYAFNKIERFNGDFNGNGYTIYNLTKPLFNYLSGTVKELHIAQSTLDKHARSGFLSKSIENGTLRDISITKNKLKTTEQEVYGISHSISDSSIINCTVSLDFTTETESVCGISEYCYRSVVQDCSVEINACDINRGAGISYDFDRSTLRNTQTDGTISLAEYVKKFGGVTGAIDGSTVVNCSSKMSITTDSMSLYKSIGGVIASSYANSTIKNCIFNGDIQFSDIEGIMCFVGGITGRLNGGVIKNCHNKADIHISGKNNIPVGGICGENAGKVIKSTNKGAISGENKVGGLVGILKGKLIRSKNIANVSGTEKVGGIIGVAEDTNSVLKTCYNASVVSGKTDVGVVLGTASESTQIKYVYFIPNADSQESKYAEKSATTVEKLDVILNV